MPDPLKKFDGAMFYAESAVMSNDDDDKGKAAREIWEYREQLGCDVAFTAVMNAWDWEHNALCEAFGTIDDLALLETGEAGPAHP